MAAWDLTLRSKEKSKESCKYTQALPIGFRVAFLLSPYAPIGDHYTRLTLPLSTGSNCAIESPRAIDLLHPSTWAAIHQPYNFPDGWTPTDYSLSGYVAEQPVFPSVWGYVLSPPSLLSYS